MARLESELNQLKTKEKEREKEITKEKDKSRPVSVEKKQPSISMADLKEKEKYCNSLSILF